MGGAVWVPGAGDRVSRAAMPSGRARGFAGLCISRVPGPCKV